MLEEIYNKFIEYITGHHRKRIKIKIRCLNFNRNKRWAQNLCNNRNRITEYYNYRGTTRSQSNGHTKPQNIFHD
jgi:hypothetical protein